MIELSNIIIKFDKTIIKEGSFKACPKKMTGIQGISGSGKSSLLDVVSLLTYDGQFDYWFDGENLKEFSVSQREIIQRTRIAYLKQQCSFLSTMNCLENVLLESEIAGHQISEKEAIHLLDKVHLKNKAKVRPSKLSGGEEQRLAVAMAMAKGADVIICDEITSMLDEENTTEMMALLQGLAYNENKIVIIASHEDEVISYADQLYLIENGALKLVKGVNYGSEKTAKNTIRKTNKKYVWQVALSRILKRKLSFILMIVVCSMTVSFLWFSKAMADENRNYWSNRLDSISQNDFFIYSNPEGDYMWPDDMLSPFYHSDFLPFDEGIQEKIGDIKEVKSVYPVIGAALIDPGTVGSSNDAALSVYKDDRLILNQTIRPGMNAGEDFTTGFDFLLDEIVFSSFEEQSLYDACEVKTSQKNGVYICYEIAKVIGLNTLEENMNLTFNLYVPGAAYDNYTPVTSYDDNNQQYQFTVKMSFPKYEKIQVSVAVSGILPENYTDSVLSTGKILMYLPYEKMSSLLAEAKEMHEMKPNEYEYKPRAYRVFFSGDVDRKQLKEEIMKIDASAVVIDNYINKLASSEAREDNDNYLLGGTRFLLLISVVLMLVYGNYHKEDVIGDALFFKIRGIASKEIKLQTVAEMIVMTVIISVLSILVSNLLMTYGLTYRYMLIFRETLSSSYPFMLAMNIGLAFLLSLISEIPLLMHQRK